MVLFYDGNGIHNMKEWYKGSVSLRYKNRHLHDSNLSLHDDNRCVNVGYSLLHYLKHKTVIFAVF